MNSNFFLNYEIVDRKAMFFICDKPYNIINHYLSPKHEKKELVHKFTSISDYFNEVKIKLEANIFVLM